MVMVVCQTGNSFTDHFCMDHFWTGQTKPVQTSKLLNYRVRKIKKEEGKKEQITVSCKKFEDV